MNTHTDRSPELEEKKGDVGTHKACHRAISSHLCRLKNPDDVACDEQWTALTTALGEREMTDPINQSVKPGILDHG